MHVHMIFPYMAANDLNIAGIADLPQQVPDPLLNLINKHAIPMLRYPYEVDF